MKGGRYEGGWEGEVDIWRNEGKEEGAGEEEDEMRLEKNSEEGTTVFGHRKGEGKGQAEGGREEGRESKTEHVRRATRARSIVFVGGRAFV